MAWDTQAICSHRMQYWEMKESIDIISYEYRQRGNSIIILFPAYRSLLSYVGLWWSVINFGGYEMGGL